MSFIHEALKRSDRARRMLGAARDAAQDAPPIPAPRRPWLVGLAVLLLANLALLLWFTLRPSAPVVPPPPLAGEVRSLAREARDLPAAPPYAADARTLPERSGPDSPDILTLDPAQRARWPELHVDAHAWSDDPAQRFVIMNLKRRTVGDTLEGGATLVEITADGVVVEFEGQRAFIARQ